MDNELVNRFFQKKLQALLKNSTRTFPTCIFEMERPEVIELVRRFCLLSPMMITYKADDFTLVLEQLERKAITDYGDLYCLVFYC
jgi:hypothetical protein